MPRGCDECYGVGCEVCNGLGWERVENKKVAAIKVLIEKYGQITRVHADSKFAYHSGNTVKAEAKNLRSLFNVIGVGDTVEIEEK